MIYLFHLFSLIKIFPLKLCYLIQGQYQTYGQSCSVYQCNPSLFLTCPSSPNGCTCPTYMSANVCDCPTNKYWSGSTCVDRSSYTGPCPTLENYNCYSGKNLICSGGTCACIDSSYFWDATSSTCSKTVSHHGSCNSNVYCTPGVGLTCQTNNGVKTCECSSPTSK